MADIPTNRKLFNLCLWIFAGLCIVLLLTSCMELPAAPQTVTPVPSSTGTAQPSPYPTTTQPAGYIVTSAALEIRTGPSETASNVGYLMRGEIVTIYATAQAVHEYCTTWAKIAPSLNRWVCLKYLKG